MKNKTRLTISMMTLLLIGLVIFGFSSHDAQVGSHRTLSFDVAEDMSRFVMDEDPVFDEDNLPAHGNSFVTVGYIYPAGTLDGSSGTNPDGSAEFPDKVIGEWICRGYFIHDGAHATDGAWVITTQIYNFSDDYGGESIVTDGYELAEVGKIGLRAITGGTGKYAGATGQAEQTLLGFNASEGVNLSFKLTLKR